MRTITTLLLVLLTSVFSISYGQQIGQYANFDMNKFYYNPAYAGSTELTVMNAAFRNQWTGFDNAPRNLNLNISGSIKNQGKYGWGVGLMNQNSGLMNQTGFHLNYAHHFRLKNDLKLAFGIQPGFIQYRVRLYDAVLADQGDQVLTGNVYNANAIDVNFGFNLYNKKFFLMAAAQRLLSTDVKFTSYNQNLAMHFNGILGYNWSVEKKKLLIQPMVMVQYTSYIPLQYAAMLKFTYDDKLWVSTSYRSSKYVGLTVGVNIKKRFGIYYGYDMTFGSLLRHNTGSHEVGISFILNKKKPTLEEEDDKLNNSILESTQSSTAK